MNLTYRVFSTLVFTVLFALVGVTAPWSAAPAYAADARPIVAAMRLLHEMHVDAPDEVKLLQTALEGLRREMERAGVTTPSMDGLRGLDAGVAVGEFQSRYDEAVAVVAGRVSEPDLRHAAIRAMADGMDDSHTSFLTPQQWRAFRERLGPQRRFTGVGIILVERDGRIYIRHALPESPAAQAGIRDFDRIIAVDGQPIVGQTLEQVRMRIRGEQGTNLELTLQRAGTAEPFTVTVARGSVASPNVLTSMLVGEVGYIRLLEFSQGAAQLLRTAIRDLQAQGMRALLFDLRGNGGGLVSELNGIAEILLPMGLPIYTLSTRAGSDTFVTRTPPTLTPSLPLSVLVDQGTASAAEILSAAIGEHRRGVVVGLQTAGAALAARLFPLPDGSALSITIARMTTGQGRVLERNGLRPEVPADMTADDLDRGVDTVVARALDVLKQHVTRLLRQVLRRAA